MKIQKYEEPQKVEFKFFKQINTFKRIQVNEISLSSNYLMYSLESCIFLVDLTHNKLMQTFDTLNQFHKQLQFSNDLKYLAYLDLDLTESTIIQLIEMHTWKKQTILDINHRSNFGFSLSGKHMFYRKMALDIYNIESTKIEDSIKLINNEILQTKYLNDTIIVLLTAQSIEFYHLPKKQFIRSYNMHRYPFYNNICQLSVQHQGLIANFPNSLKQRYMNVMCPQNNKLIFKLDAGFTHWKWIYFKDYYIYQKSGVITIIDIGSRMIVQKIERLSSQMIYSNFQFQNNTLVWGETEMIIKMNQYESNIKYRYQRSIDISQIYSLKISLDSKANVLILQSNDYIYLMDIHKEDIIGSFSAHYSLQSNLPQFSNNSQYLAFITNQKSYYSIQIVDYTTHIFKYIHPPIIYNKDSIHLEFHDEVAYFGLRGSKIHCYNLKTRPLDVELLDIQFDQFQLIGNDLLITIFEFKINIWNIRRMHRIKKYKMPEGMRFNDLLLRAPRNYISPNFKSKHGSNLYMICLQNYKIISKITPENMTHTALTQKGSHLIYINYNNFEILDLQIRKVTQTIQISNDFRQVLFSQNGKLLLLNNLMNIIIYQLTI